MSQITKRALAAALKKELREKPLDKITIADIVEECGVGRQTFYYHFKDIYDLLEWTYLEETERVVGDAKTYETWPEGYGRLLAYLMENKSFVSRTYHSLSREYLERFLGGVTAELLLNVLRERNGRDALECPEADMRYIAEFYKYGFVGLTLDWIRDGMKKRPEELVERLSVLLRGSFEDAMKRFSHKR